MNGLAITIIVGQLPKLCGFSTDADGFVDEVRAFVREFDETQRDALVVGVATLAVLLVLPRFTPQDPRGPRRRRRRHRGHGGVRPRRQGVATVGALPQGLPAPSAARGPTQRRRTAAGRGASASRWCR